MFAIAQQPMVYPYHDQCFSAHQQQQQRAAAAAIATSSNTSNALAPRDANARPYFSFPTTTKMAATPSSSTTYVSSPFTPSISTRPSTTTLHSSENTEPATPATPAATTSSLQFPHPQSQQQPQRPGPSRPTHTRGSKFSSLTRDPAAQRTQRRAAFLGRVKEAREEARHEQRGEMSARRHWLELDRAWSEAREREGEMWLAAEEELEELEMDMGGQGDVELPPPVARFGGQQEGDAEMDEVELLAREEEMYAAMATAAESSSQALHSEMTDYGSDDDDYERLMLDIAMQAESASQTVDFESSGRVGDQAMDMS